MISMVPQMGRGITPIPTGGNIQRMPIQMPPQQNINIVPGMQKNVPLGGMMNMPMGGMIRPPLINPMMIQGVRPMGTNIQQQGLPQQGGSQQQQQNQ
jgi:hypothetical protein